MVRDGNELCYSYGRRLKMICKVCNKPYIFNVDIEHEQCWNMLNKNNGLGTYTDLNGYTWSR